jgi:hypothetical protein
MPVLGIVALVAGLLLVVADAYARRGRNREQQASLERENQGLAARSLLSSLSFQALVMMDARGYLESAPPQSLFGYAESELLGHNILRHALHSSARNPIVACGVGRRRRRWMNCAAGGRFKVP